MDHSTQSISLNSRLANAISKKNKNKTKNPDTGLYTSSSPTSTPPLTPNSKKRLAKERRALDRSTQGNRRARNEFILQTGRDKISRIPITSPLPFTSSPPNQIAPNVPEHPCPKENDLLANPSSQDRDVDLDMDLDMCWNSTDFDISVSDPVNLDASDDRQGEFTTHEHRLKNPSASRQAYRFKAAPEWEKLIERSDKFMHAFLGAERRIYYRNIEEEPVCECMCSKGSRMVQCVSLQAMSPQSIEFCENCSSFPVELMRRGFFPATPNSPRVGFHITLLKFYSKIDLTHKTPVAAFTDALVSGLEESGHVFDNREPFLQQLRFTLPYFYKLQRKINQMVRWEIDKIDDSFIIPTPALASTEKQSMEPGRASPALRRRCPACFGRESWGGDPDTSPDVIVALDGNFQHRRFRHVKEDPRVLAEGDEYNWISEKEIQAAKEHVESCRKNNSIVSHRRPSTQVPRHVLDECEKSYKASLEKDQDPEAHIYDAKGVMALVCRHDIPIYIADIKTLGEPRYYAVALLRKIAADLPSKATIGVMYDIAEQLDRMIGKHNLIPELSPRLSFALALFHAFGHQMACQVVYNPRWRKGFGFSNGEGNERVWSLCTDTIAPERVMGPYRRKLTLSLKMESIGTNKRDTYYLFRNRMKQRIDTAAEKSLAIIQEIPALNGVRWTRETLLQQGELKKADHLNLRECRSENIVKNERTESPAANSNQISHNVRLLLDATRNASGMSKALNEVNEDLMRYDYAQSLLGSEQVQGLRQISSTIVSLHKETIEKLETLSQNLGLSTVKLPVQGQVHEQDQKYLRHLVHLQTLRRVLWINLQSYQDEAIPITDSSSRGGSTRRLGTTKLSSTAKVLKGKAKQVSISVQKFNAVLEQLGLIRRPEFVPEGLIPPKLNAKDLLYLKPEDPLWDEVFGGVQWTSNWEDPGETTQVPEYARSKQVRDGIRAAYRLERAEEEDKRLQVETVNCINEWIFEIIQTWECLSQQSESSISHRLNLELQQALRRRPRFDNHDIYSHSALFTGSFTSLTAILSREHPISLLRSNQTSTSSYTSIFSSVEPGEIDAPYVIGDLDTTADEINDGITRLEDADEVDEVEATAAHNSIDAEIAHLVLQDQDQQANDELVLPPVRNLISNSSNLPLSNPIIPYRQDCLPPVAVLIDSIDNPEKIANLGSVNRLLGIARSANLSTSTNRIALGSETRFFRDLRLDADIIKSLDENRHINPTIVTSAAHLLKERIESGPLNSNTLGIRSNNLVLLTMDWKLALKGQGSEFLEYSLNAIQKSSHADRWLSPVLLLGPERQWVLLEMEFQANTYSISSGSTLSNPGRGYCQKVAALVQKLYSAFWGRAYTQPAPRSYPTSVRQANFADSSIWCLAELQRHLLNQTKIHSDWDPKRFRNLIRDLVSSLPQTPLPVAEPRNSIPDAVRSIFVNLRNGNATR